jgi:hypothetical protein
MKSALTLIAAVALTLAVGACSKEEKKNEAPAPTAAPPTENTGAATPVDDMAAKMAAEMSAQAMKTAAAASETAAAAAVTAEAAGESAEAAGAAAEAAGAAAEAAGAAAEGAVVVAPGVIDDAIKAMEEIATAAEQTNGDCAKILTTVAPVITKHKGTFEALGKAKNSQEVQAKMMANLALMQRMQKAMMPLAMCAAKDPKIAEMLSGMK